MKRNPLTWCFCGLALTLGSGSGQLVAQETKAFFDAPVIELPPYDDPFSYVLDYDGDGDLDAIGDWTDPGSNYAYHYFSVYLNNGQGVFTFLDRDVLVDNTSGSSNLHPFLVATGKLDGDPREDFVIGAAHDLEIYYSQPGQPQLHRVINYGNFVLDIVIGDLDNDGQNELLVLTTNRTRVYELNAGVWTVADVVLNTALDHDSSLALAELDGNPGIDLAILTPSEIQLYSYDGSLFNAEALHVHTTAAFHPVVGDVTGNGLEDLVLFGPSDYQLLRQVSAGVCQLDDAITGGPATHFADMDADGDLDGLCCSGGGGGPFHEDPAMFEIAENLGGSFAASYTMDGLAARKLAGAEDFNNDGRVDLLAGRVIYYGKGTLPPTSPTTSLTDVAEESLVDAEGDGDLDLQLTLDSVGVSQGDGSFAFSAMARDPDPAEGTLVGPGIAGDFDGDGDADLIVEVHDGLGFVQMQLLRNRGGGSFEDAGPAAAPGVQFMVEGPDPELVVVRDVEGDGDLDVLSRTQVTPTYGSTVWVNDGSGSFSAGFSQIPSGRWLLEVAEFTGDSHLDLFSHGPGGFLIYPGLGGGAFGNPIIAVPGSSRFQTMLAFEPMRDRVAVGDFNADGYTDILAIDKTGFYPELCFLANQGPTSPGTFIDHFIHTRFFHSTLTQLEYSQGTSHQIHAEDLDGDGDLDALVQPLWGTGGGALILENSQPFPWGRAVQMADTQTLADLDGDGVVDGVGSRFVRNRKYKSSNAGLRQQYGNGTAGAGGETPTLGACGPFRAGESAALHLVGAAGQSFALLAVSLQPSETPNFPAPGLTSYLGPWTWFGLLPTGGSLHTPGAGSFTLPYVVPADVAGVSVYHQCILTDPETYLVASNGLLLDYR